MILRKYMSLLGIGSARIDLVLPKKEYRPGENITGRFLIRGGTIKQDIKRVECDLVLIDESQKIQEVIGTTTLLTVQSVHPEESIDIPFNFKLPHLLRISTDKRSYRFQTRLFFDEGVKSEDQDIINIDNP